MATIHMPVSGGRVLRPWQQSIANKNKLDEKGTLRAKRPKKPHRTREATETSSSSGDGWNCFKGTGGRGDGGCAQEMVFIRW